MSQYHRHEGCQQCLKIPAYARKIKLENELEVNPEYVVTCKHNKAWFWGVDPERVQEANNNPDTFHCSCDEPVSCHRCGGTITPKAVNAGEDIIDGEEGHRDDCPLLDNAREPEECVECGHEENNHSNSCVSVE